MNLDLSHVQDRLIKAMANHHALSTSVLILKLNTPGACTCAQEKKPMVNDMNCLQYYVTILDPRITQFNLLEELM